ncbi:MAG: ATP-binding protein [Thermodesulfobacteriota bacterium]
MEQQTFLFSYLHFGVMLTYVYLAAYVLGKSPRTPINRACFLMTMCFALWSMLMAVLQNPAVSLSTVRAVQMVGAVGWIGFVPAFVVFSLLLTDRAATLSRPATKAALILPPLFLYFLQSRGLLVYQYVPQYYGYGFLWHPGIWTWLLIAYYTITFWTGTILLYDYSRKTTNIAKKKLARVTLGNAVFVVVFASISNMILPMAGVLSVPAVADVMALFWVFFLAHLMERNRALIISPAMAADNILASMSDCLILLTPDGFVANANPAAQRLLGRGRELAGIPACEAFPEKLCSEILSGHDMKNLGVRVGEKEGEETFLLLSTAQLRNEDGQIAGVVCMAKDITDQKRMEQVQDQMEARLIQIQRLESLGTLAGGIAHNFNNLLMGIQGNASLALLRPGKEEELRARLSKIQDLVKEGATLTANLLGYARKGRYESRSLDVNRLVTETSSAFEATARNILVVRELTPNLPPVVADQAQMEQVLFNLYVNANDAMPEEGELFLTTSLTDASAIKHADELVIPGKYVRISVRDTGAGMDEPVLQHIFEPFYTTKGLSRGSGLGLSSAYGIVRGHGGHIQVASQKGGGTTFDIFLPVGKRKQGEAI